jgi:hypothetical protein
VSTVREDTPGPRLHPLPPHDERQQQLELQGRHLDLGARDLDAVSVTVDLQLRDLRDDRLLRLASPQHRVHAQHELAHAERLDHVVVGAELEADDAVDLLSLGRDHDDGDVLGARLSLESRADGGPGPIGEHQIEQHDVRHRVAREAKARFGGGGGLNAMPGLGEVVLEDLAKIRLVLDEDHSCHGGAR